MSSDSYSRADLLRDATILAMQSETLLIEAHYLRAEGGRIVERYLRPQPWRVPVVLPTERAYPQYPVQTLAFAIVREMGGYKTGEMY